MSKGSWNRKVSLCVEPDRARPCHVIVYLENTTQTLSKSTRESEQLEDIYLTPDEAKAKILKAFAWAVEIA